MLSEASLTEFAGEILLTWVPPSTATSTRIDPSKQRPEATTPGVIGVFSGALAYRGSGPFTTGGGIALDQGALVWIGTGGSADVTLASGGFHCGSGILVTDLDSQNMPITLTNSAEIQANFAGQTLSIQTTRFTNAALVAATQGGTLAIAPASFMNLASGTLTGGSYYAAQNSAVLLPGAVATLEAAVDLDGAGSKLFGGGHSLEASLAEVGPAGLLLLNSGRNLALTQTLALDGQIGLSGGTIDNAGDIVAGGGTLLLQTYMAAVEIGRDTLTFAVNRANTVWIDHSPVSFAADGAPTVLAGGIISQTSPTSWIITDSSGRMVTVSSSGTGLDAYVQLPSDTLPGSVRGLDGTDSGNLANEFSLPDGTVLAQPLSYTDLYTTWANAWCVTPSTSLMDYGPGQPTATFTDPNFPGDATAISSLPANVMQNAENLVAQAGITDPTLAHDALDDYLFTGDPTFIQGALDAQSAGMGPIATATNPAPPGTTAGVRQETVDDIQYFHIELDRHDVVLAERLPVESFLDTGNRVAFANRGTLVAAFPDFELRVWEAEACAPLVVTGAPVDHLRGVLSRRAEQTTRQRSAAAPKRRRRQTITR